MMKQDILDYYDWAVIGDHPGALLSGAIAAKLGFSVLILPVWYPDEDDKTISRLAHLHRPSGQFVDPEFNFLLGLGAEGQSGGLLFDSLQRIGAYPLAGRHVKFGEKDLPQVIGPEIRLELSKTIEALHEELNREVSSEFVKTMSITSAIDSIQLPAESFWKSFPRESGFVEPGSEKRKVIPLSADEHYWVSLVKAIQKRRGIGREWGNLNADTGTWRSSEAGTSAVDELMSAIWYSVSQIDEEAPKLVRLLSLLGVIRTAGSFKGGISAYRRFLIDLAHQNGAAVHNRRDCQRLFVEDGQIIGIQVAGRSSMIGVSGAVLGCSLDHASPLVWNSGKKRGSMKKPPLPYGWKFTLSMTVHKEGIPSGVASKVIWKEKGAPAIEIEVADPRDYDRDGNEHRYIFVRTWLPFEDQSLDPNYQQILSARMFRQLKTIFPFIEYHVVRLFPDFRTGLRNNKDEFSEAYPYVSVSLIPENLRCIKGEGAGFESGVGGLYVASGESYPDLGSLGGVVAGIQAISNYLSVPGNTEDPNVWDRFWSEIKKKENAI